MNWSKLFEELRHGELRFLATKATNRVLGSAIRPFQVSEDLNPVFLFSSTRSGSTWLFELILRSETYRAVFEPLPGLEECLRDRGTPRVILDKDSEDQGLRELLNSIMAKNGHRRGPGSERRLNSRNIHFFTKGVVAKSTRANFCVDFIHHTLEDDRTRFLFLIRNPFAVVRSKILRGEADSGALGSKFSYNPADLFKTPLPSFHDSFSGYQALIQGLDDRIRLETAAWCIENKPVLDLLRHRPWRLVVFEDLFVDFKKKFKEITDFLGIPYEERSAKHRGTKSTTSFSGKDRRFLRSSSFQDERRFLGEWNSFFSTHQIDQMMEVIRAFGIDYGALLDEKARDLVGMPE
jgi:hypothetical protein